MSRKDKYANLCSGLSNLSLRGKGGNHSKQSFQAAPPTPCVANPNLFNINHSGSKVVTYRNIHPSEDIYDKIENLITNDSFIIDNIVKINNSFLEKAYKLKKDQKKIQYGEDPQENLLFHGTKKANLNSICTFNFDWRMYGKNSGHKFGKGVSFSTNATYASNYSDEDSDHKVMIVAKVLVSNVCQGHKDMVLPLSGHDTSQKGDHGIVVVKYEDNEFLPAYKLYYHFEEDDSDDDDFCEDDYDEDDDSQYDNYYY